MRHETIEMGARLEGGAGNIVSPGGMVMFANAKFVRGGAPSGRPLERNSI